MAKPHIPDSIEKGNVDDPLTICGFGCLGGTISCASPYVGKVETFCRMNDIPYEVLSPGDKKSKKAPKSPKSTLPYIIHGSTVLSDSTFILDYLTNTFPEKITTKSSSDPFLRGMAVAAQRLCENHLYWGVVYYRWVDPDGASQLRPLFFKSVPFPLKGIASGVVGRGIQDTMRRQGFGRHSKKDVYKLLDDSLSALSDIIGENKFLTGGTPCPEDASVFGVLDNYLNQGLENDSLKELASKYPNLSVYVENMREAYFPGDNPSKFQENTMFK
ncbi:hypothetical protein BSKO_09024 [Bryopsis sp. KO-2023]|nr:hypothetical protein BSKO_09024 [Bryopsis sp. KO-2023]